MKVLQRMLEAVFAGLIGAVIALSAYYVYLDRSGALNAKSAECENSVKPVPEMKP